MTAYERTHGGRTPAEDGERAARQRPRGLEPKAVIGKDGRTLTVICDGQWVTIPLGFDVEVWARIQLAENAKAAEVVNTTSAHA